MNEAGTFQGESICPHCGRTFTCGMRAGHQKCWCADLPHQAPPQPAANACYCPDCLRETLSRRQDQPR